MSNRRQTKFVKCDVWKGLKYFGTKSNDLYFFYRSSLSPIAMKLLL